MKFMFYIMLIALTCLNSCKKAGCLDAEALNVDLEAQKDDGSCQYRNDIFLGVYSASDTIDNDLQFGLVRSYLSYEFEIKREKGNEIKVVGFFRCSEDLLLEPDSQSITFYGHMFCDRSLNAHFELSGNVLKYNCIHSNSSGQIYRWGTAIKQ